MIKIDQLQAYEFENGQDLLSGPVGTWFVAPANKILPLDENPTDEKMIFVRSESCGPGWYQMHPMERKDGKEES